MKKQTNILKKTGLIVLLTIIMIILGKVISQAGTAQVAGVSSSSLGGQIEFSFSDLEGRYGSNDNTPIVYCMDHGGHLSGGPYTYDVNYYGKIEGKKLTITSTDGKEKILTNKENAIIAYILGGGTLEKGYGKLYNNTVRQIALWTYINTWFNKSDLPYVSVGNATTESTAESRQLVSEAKKYADSVGKNNVNVTDATITADPKKVVTENEYAGPFKVTYTGGNISSVIVKDENGKQIKSGIEFYTDANGRNKINALEIESGKSFYIKNTSGKVLGSLSIKVKPESVYYENVKLEFWLLDNGWENQNLMITKTDNDIKKPIGDEVEVTIEIETDHDITIKGYVWVDVPNTKSNLTNSKYDDGEKRVSGVKVFLVNKSGDVKASTVTDENGQYTFANETTEKTVKDYYIGFNYTGTEYNQYIPVAFNSENKDEIIAEGSRALKLEVEENDADLKGIASTYRGTDKEQTYGLSGNLYDKLYDKNTYTLNDINLGIKETLKADYTINQNIEFVKITMRGYTYKYSYANNGNDNANAAPTVNFGNRTLQGYTRSFYPEDISYSMNDVSDGIKVIVRYRINITNTTNHDIEDLYSEKKMYVKYITDTFDTNRYELKDENWDANGNIATIHEDYLQSKLGNGLGKNETGTVKIEFEVKDAAINKILINPQGIEEEAPTIAYATAYHKYTRKDYSWNNDIVKEQTHTTIDDTREARAPYLIFRLGNERHISGRIFEDAVISTNGEALGNGLYDEGENVVGDVKVELLDINADTDLANLTVASLYKINQENNSITQKAEVLAGKDGTYTLSGIVPGEYFLRFTYGDGTQKLFDLAGNELKAISSKDYKSTIVTSNIVKKAIKGIVDNETAAESTLAKEDGKAKIDYIWYKNLDKDNYSVVVDNLESRKAANDVQGPANLVAGTARISITIENTLLNVKTIDTEGEIQIEADTSAYVGFNFGIVRQPKTNFEISNIVTNVKLTDAQGQILIDGNPKTAKMQGVTDLDGRSNGGSVYTRIERDSKVVYGATLDINYELKITNTSEVNYYGENYYWFGDKEGCYEVTLNIDEVMDTLNTSFALTNSVNGQITSNGKTIAEVSEPTSKNLKLRITNWNNLYTELNKERKEQRQTSDSVNYALNRILSNQDDDMLYINTAEVTAVTNETDLLDANKDQNRTNILKTIVPAKLLNAKAESTVTITPPTGADIQAIIIYSVTTVVSLAVVIYGIVLIKKKFTK